MSKRQVFISFDYDEDVFRASQVKNIGVLEENTIIAPNEWEKIKLGGDEAIKKWIDSNMQYRSCLVVLIGEKTHKSQWVKYEIKKAWNDGKGILGIYIHNLKDPNKGFCCQGENPFKNLYINRDTGKVDDSTASIFYVQNMSERVKCYIPNPENAYDDIAKNMEHLIEEALAARN